MGWNSPPDSSGARNVAPNVARLVSGTRAALTVVGFRRPRDLGHIDLDRAPEVVVWEATRPADVRRLGVYRDGAPLSTTEAAALIDQVVAIAPGVLVMGGDDPLARSDSLMLAARAGERGLRLVLSSRSPARLTGDVVACLADAGVRQIALAIDGPDAAVHDLARRAPGSFGHTLAAIDRVRAAGMSCAIDTRLQQRSLAHLEATGRLVRSLAPALWRVGVVVPMQGIGLAEQVSAADEEAVLHFLYDWREATGVAVETVAAPAFRRVAAQRDALRRAAGERVARARPLPINDGKGMVFVSHTGRVMPSSALPLGAGSIREEPLGTIYQHSRLFRALRATWRLEGRCGVCPYNALCGGSRARAFATSGNFLAEDPACAYVPPTVRLAAGTM